MKLDWKGLFEKIKKAQKRYEDGHNFTCDLCGREVFENERVCEPCKKSLPWNNANICPFCGRKVKEAGTCIECKDKPIGVDKARSAFTHEGVALAAVSRYKRGARFMYRTFGELCIPLLKKEFSDADVITFVPMTQKAEKRRGYNQSRLLAEELSQRSGIPILDLAEKTRDTNEQKSLGRRDREENLKGCFRVTKRSLVKGKRVLIVDDTMTTGATAGELSSALRKAGARNTYLLTITSVAYKNPYGTMNTTKKQR